AGISTQANLDQITAGTLSWPATSANALGNIDDLWHASVNGRGKFIEASDPDSFVSGLRNALATIAERTSSSSNVAANSTRLDTGTQVFQANFITGRWTGDLISYPVSAAGVGVTPPWRASQNMPVWSSRNIITWNTASNVGSDFPTAAQQTALGGVNVTNYLRGNQTLIESNGGPYRNRLSLLGDIDHSSPIFVVGDTTVTPNIPAMVYVGGNDGMLHAFNASTGVEVFGYIPGGTNLATLKTLSDPDYQHAYFVDGELAISSKAQTPGQNILVGVMGRGGKTVYAIDVTDPANVDETKVLWEYSNAELGNVLGKPIIAKINDSSNRTGVLIGNGFNSASGHSALFVLDIATGTLIKKLDPAVGNTTTLSNGMSTPRGWDIDRSGTIDEVYAGDLLGNIWKFDLSSSTISNWDSAFKTGSVMNPFYSAKDALGNAQPITGGLSVGLDPNTFARWVFFGTGRYLTSGDPASQAVQTWYGMMDASAKIATNNRTTNDQLKERKTKVVTTQSGKIVRAFEEPVAGDMTGYKGWYVDLVDSTTSPVTKEGERIITDSVLIGGVLIAASIIPTNSSCDVGGRGFINAIDPFTGGAVDTAFFD
ncbi:MAG: hypothetical protein LH616_14465, partial [Ilumatobacteraceae bacterium]|nr:hypothetical protein [Ilumatobacteraceae bacterium]